MSRYADYPLRRKILVALLAACGLVMLITGVAAGVAVYLRSGPVRSPWPVLLLGIVIVALTLVVLGIAVAVAARLQEALAEPIINLARSARSADTAQPFPPRVVQESDDEVGQLVRAFNELLERLGEREGALQRANTALEQQGRDLERQLAQQRQSDLDLREREAKLRLVLERVPAVIWTTDWDLRFTSSTGGRLGTIQLRGNEVVGTTLYEYFGTNDHSFPSIAAHRRALAGEQVSYEQDWQGCHFRTHVEPLFDATQQIIGVTGVAVDASEEQRAAEHCRQVLETAPDPIFTLAPDGVITSLNRAFERYAGWQRENWIGKQYGPLLHPDDLGQAAELFREVMAGQTPPLQELRCRTRSGDYLIAQFHVAPLMEGDQVTGFLGVARDVSRERRLQQQVLEISAREQDRIGRDLHDGLCQELVGTSFQAAALENALRCERHPAATTAAGVAAMIERAVEQARDLARGLHPVQLGAAELPASLSELASQTGRVYDVTCEFRTDGSVTVADDLAAAHLCRIAQEAVGNAARHGRPRCIVIGLGRDNDREYLRVTDDGCGFAARSAPARARGLGIHLMEYRARAIGGKLDIVPAAGGGTRVTCSWSSPTSTEGD
ncbi:PAS domain-containing protein [bacterium]|nr:PAS domain-containing protein [bacterium]